MLTTFNFLPALPYKILSIIKESGLTEFSARELVSIFQLDKDQVLLGLMELYSKRIIEYMGNYSTSLDWRWQFNVK